MSGSVTVSVIMPVYNVERYVGRAIESILSQTFEDFEFLIVDDGTPDNSGRICDEYAARDGRITVIHKENGGAPSARNTAMDRAKGRYYYFLDSDDWAEPTMLADMVALAEQHKAQLVVAGFYIDTYYNDTDYVTQTLSQPSAVYDRETFRREAYRLFDHNLLYTPWNKLFSADYIEEHGLRFPQTFWDDFPFVLSVIRDVERVCVTEKAYYHFLRARAESETAKYVAAMYDKREEEHGWMEELYRYWAYTSPETEEFLARRYIERLVGCLENVTNPQCTLSPAEQRKAITRMIGSERAQKAVRLARPRSKKMKLLLWPVRLRATWLAYGEGKLISRVKTAHPKWFATMKANR